MSKMDILLQQMAESCLLAHALLSKSSHKTQGVD